MEKTIVTASFIEPPRLAVASDLPRAASGLPTGQKVIRPEDSVYFACDLVHEGANGNGDIFTRAEMERSWPTLIGMAVDKDHDMKVDGTVGQIYDAKYLIIAGRAVIRVAGYINSRFYPDVAWKLLSGVIKGVSMECFFEYGERRSEGRYLHGVQFIGMAVTRIPADSEALIDHLKDHEVTASRRLELIEAAARIVAGMK